MGRLPPPFVSHLIFRFKKSCDAFASEHLAARVAGFDLNIQACGEQAGGADAGWEVVSKAISWRYGEN